MTHDKRLHLAVGLAVSFFAGLIWEPWVGMLLATIAGAAKEVYDMAHPKTPPVDIWDFWATFAGGIGGTVLVLVARYTWVAAFAA